MKKCILTAFAIVMAMAANAQLVRVASQNQVALPSGVVSEVATISPDGSFVAVGELGGNTIWKVSLPTGMTNVITSNGTASDVVISPDGKNIVFRTHTFDKNHLRHTGLNYVDASGSEHQLVAPSRRLNAGVAIAQSGITAVENGRARVKAFGGAKAASLPVASINYGHLEVNVDGRTTVIDPQGRGSYLWPSISPDGTKVLYTLSGAGTFVCNLDGSDARYIGHLQAPKWMGGDMVVAMQSEDDGQYVTASKVIVSTLDGRQQTISAPGEIAMYPSASADGKKIAYGTADGKLVIVNIQ